MDHYCERTSEAWHAEPLNALSNLAFFVAGWAAWRLLARAKYRGDDRLLKAMISLMPLIGVGSIIFHTLATRWAEWLDVIPILLFMTLYLWFTLDKFLEWPIAFKLPALGLFFLATFVLEAFVPGTFLWGGAMYLPTVLVLLLSAATSFGGSPSVSQSFLLATGLFLVSLSLRTIDQSVCPNLPSGTHVMWHLLNAALLYHLVRLVIVNEVTRRPETESI
ncbi:MAG: ceramidase domain-containing protein [Proteobacteria bacterium]|nr:ceramidase domain-containing protein [Pseudomonadota bacterium]